MKKKIEYKNGYIEIYNSHCFAHNYLQKRSQVFMMTSIPEIKKSEIIIRMNLN